MVKANIGPESREIAPGMVVFNATTLGKSTITSWENGPQKQPGTAKRGRPRKGDVFLICYTSYTDRVKQSTTTYELLNAPKIQGLILSIILKHLRDMGLNYKGS